MGLEIEVGVGVLRFGELISFWIWLSFGVLDCTSGIFLVSEVERLFGGSFGTWDAKLQSLLDTIGGQ